MYLIILVIINYNVIYLFNMCYSQTNKNIFIFVYNTLFYNNLNYIVDFFCFFDITSLINKGLLKNIEMLLDNSGSFIFKKLLLFSATSLELYNYNMQILQVVGFCFMFFVFIFLLLYLTKLYTSRFFEKIF